MSIFQKLTMIDNNKNNNFRLITKKQINKLRLETREKDKKWDRICLHEDNNSKIHSMIICMLSGVESGYHKNLNSNDIVTYSYLGKPFKVKIIQDINEKIEKVISIDFENPLISIKDNIFRSIINNSNETIIYLEHRAGPYIREKITWLN